MLPVLRGSSLSSTLCSVQGLVHLCRSITQAKLWMLADSHLESDWGFHSNVKSIHAGEALDVEGCLL